MIIEKTMHGTVVKIERDRNRNVIVTVDFGAVTPIGLDFEPAHGPKFFVGQKVEMSVTFLPGDPA